MFFNIIVNSRGRRIIYIENNYKIRHLDNARGKLAISRSVSTLAVGRLSNLSDENLDIGRNLFVKNS